MGNRRRLVILPATLLCAMIMQPVDAKNVALLVAVGQFSDPQLRSQQLLGTAPDIEAMQRALTANWGFLPADVLALRDRDATHERILREISALEKRTAPGDTVLIYFSGHGTSANAENNSFDLPYATGAWVPYDLDSSTLAAAQKSLIVGRRDLVPRLQRLDQGGRLVVVVSDSCYSGQVVRSFGQTFSRSRYLQMPTRDLGVARVGAALAARPPPPPYPYQHVVLLAGASDSETGADISSPQALQLAPTLDGQYHGAFTDAFLRLLDGQLLPGAFNYSQGREAMNTFLEHRNFAQHPQLLPAIAEDPRDVGSNAFLGMPGGSRAGSGAVPLVAAPREPTLQVRLEAVRAPLREVVRRLPGIEIVETGGDLVLRQQGDRAQLLGPAGDPIASTTAMDPLLLKRIAAHAWLKRILPADDAALGLRSETDPGSRGNTFLQCESFVFEVRLKKPAYVMLLNLDAQGNLTVLYPTRAAERTIIAAGTPVAIPGGNPEDHILVTPPFGSDQVAVIAFERRPDFFADLDGAERFAAEGSRAAALATGLKSATGAIGVQQITVRTYAGGSGGLCGS